MRKKKYLPLVKNSKRRRELESNKEASVLKKANRRLLTIFAWVGIILMSIIIISCTIDIFDFFYKLHPHAGYLSLAIIVFLLSFLVIRPIIVALSTPCKTSAVLASSVETVVIDLTVVCTVFLTLTSSSLVLIA